MKQSHGESNAPEALETGLESGSATIRWMMKSHNKNFDDLTAEIRKLRAQIAAAQGQSHIGTVRPWGIDWEQWYSGHKRNEGMKLYATPIPQQVAEPAQPDPSEMTKERESYIAGLESRTREMRKKIEQIDYELRVARSSQNVATYTPPRIIDPDAPHPCFN